MNNTYHTAFQINRVTKKKKSRGQQCSISCWTFAYNASIPYEYWFEFQQKMAQMLRPLHPHTRPGSSQILASAWSSAESCNPLGSEAVDERYHFLLSLSAFTEIHKNKSLKKILIQSSFPFLISVSVPGNADFIYTAIWWTVWLSAWLFTPTVCNNFWETYSKKQLLLYQNLALCG